MYIKSVNRVPLNVLLLECDVGCIFHQIEPVIFLMFLKIPFSNRFTDKDCLVCVLCSLFYCILATSNSCSIPTYL